MEELELRMYFFVPYNISEIQKGIQSGHSMGEYALKYGRYNPNHIVWDFLEKWKTWIILNGGTTSFKIIEVGNESGFYGSLNQIQDSLEKHGIEYSTFVEPDINDALTAVCVILDERVFNFKKYPDEVDFNDLLSDATYDYDEWVETMGGEKNVFLRELIKGKRLA